MERPPADDTGRSVDVFLQHHAHAIPLTSHESATIHRHEDYQTDVSYADEWTAQDTVRALVGLTYDTYLGLKFYHSDPLPRIEQAWRERMDPTTHSGGTNVRFRDCEFPTHEPIRLVDPETGRTTDIAPGIITSSNIRDLMHSGQAKRVRRVQHFLQHASRDWHWTRLSGVRDMTTRALFASGPWHSVQARTVVQGQVGNCGFCSALASVAASFPHGIRNAFGDHSEHCLATCGAYSVQMYLSGISNPRYLLLDDYVLCQRPRERPNNGTEPWNRSLNPRDVMTSPSIHAAPVSTGIHAMEDMWPRLLEKAFVKVQGSYASLDGFYKYQSLYRHPGRALQLLTGCAMAVELHWDNALPPLLVYDTLVATQDRYARIAHCRRNGHGLHSNHGYSLLWVGHVTWEQDCHAVTERLVCLRNPHGRGSYTGPSYGVQSDSWRTHKGQQVVAQLLRLDCFESFGNGVDAGATWHRHHSDDTTQGIPCHVPDDGIFFMGFDAFVKCFPVVTVVGPIPRIPAAESSTEPSIHQSTASLRADCIYQIHGNTLSHAIELFAAANAAQGKPTT